MELLSQRIIAFEFLLVLNLSQKGHENFPITNHKALLILKAKKEKKLPCLICILLVRLKTLSVLLFLLNTMLYITGVQYRSSQILEVILHL